MNDDEELQQIKGALAEAVARGHIEIVGYSDEGEACYRLTPAGVADVERRFGLTSNAEAEERYGVKAPSQARDKGAE